ncbi:hypothetical protein FSP39_002567 [Pinctada imbricata]|uniref:Diphosphomevalonate decarboxylase n=1 Tax=Pinctada imbricata TaxID=66713 RepID=A0AA88XGZ1_PINIB|nr:hypothetical protein FSP39_002567 [Pinctada imbricata]
MTRLGSGSACRSMFGGFVVWDKGCHDNGVDSVSHQIRPESHWPDLRVLILVVSDQTKHTSSTDGMQSSVETSSLLHQRLQTVPQKEEKITQAIIDRDFQTFAEITMKDSNQFHAVCLDTYPPISYLTDVSRQIIQLIHMYNKYHSCNKAAYTFDAGPNACIYLLEEAVPELLQLITHFFGSDEKVNGTFVQGIDAPFTDSQVDVSQFPLQQNKGAVKYIIYTKPGPGPQILTDPTDSLISTDGQPANDPR